LINGYSLGPLNCQTTAAPGKCPSNSATVLAYVCVWGMIVIVLSPIMLPPYIHICMCMSVHVYREYILGLRVALSSGSVICAVGGGGTAPSAECVLFASGAVVVLQDLGSGR